MDPHSFDTVQIMLIIFGLFMSALYSASEAVVMSMSVDRTRQMIEEGGPRAGGLKFLVSHPTEILTTILIGNNLVNTMVASLVTTLTSAYFKDYAIAVAAGSATLLILIFGEIGPKSFARSQAEKLLGFVVWFLKVSYYLLYPAVFLLSFFIKKILGKNAQLQGKLVTTEDIEYLVNRAEADQSIDSKHIDLINSILEFPTIKVRDIMVPRARVDYITLDASNDELMSIVKDKEHSRYPVVKSNLDDVIGLVHVKDYFLAREFQGHPISLESLLKPPFYVYEHMKIQAVFDYMNRSKVHMAFVRDETGMIVGIITLEDIMEEIFGEISDEYDNEEKKDIDQHFTLAEGILVHGSLALRELEHDYDIELPNGESYTTLTGFLLELLGNHFPKTGQIIFWESYSFELVKVLNYQIEEVRIKQVNKTLGDEDQAEHTHSTIMMSSDQQGKNGNSTSSLASAQ